jgi:FeS assembly SUF system protein
MALPIMELEQNVIGALHRCFDPEIPVDIYELGLVYEVNIDDAANAHIKMTLTSPMCPAAQSLPSDVQAKVELVPGINNVRVEVVWSPPWNTDMMSEAAKLELGFL